MKPYDKWRDDVALQEYINSTNMEHTYIEQFDKEFPNISIIAESEKLEALLGKPQTASEAVLREQDITRRISQKERIRYFILKVIKSVRIDTLMECRGLVGDDEDFKIQPDGEYHFSENQKTIGRNQQRESFRTTIDTLIKKETI